MRCLYRPNGGHCRLQTSFRLAMMLLASVIVAAAPAMADIYRFVDKDGVIHYTDDPAKIPPEYESVVEHRSIQRSPAAEQTPPPAESDQRVQPEEAGAGGPERSGEQGAQPGGQEGGAGLEASGGTNAYDETGQQGGEVEAPSGDIEEAPEVGQPPETEEGGAEPSEAGPADREQLLQERQALLQRQAELLNNTSYQSRKTKRKYQNRPYIQEMMAEEARIEARLKEINQLLQ